MKNPTPIEISNAIHTDRRRRRRVKISAFALFWGFYLTLAGLAVALIARAVS